MNRKLILLAAAISIFGLACVHRSKSAIHISGTYAHAGTLFPSTGGRVYLQEVSGGKDQAPVALDSAKITGNSGSFSLNAIAKGGEEEIFELVFGDMSNNILAVPIIADEQDINVDVDLAKRDDFYKVSGSEASVQLKGFIDALGKKSFLVDKYLSQLDSLKRIGSPDSVLLGATTEKNNALDDLNSYLKHFIESSTNPTLSTLALGWSSRSLSQEDFEKEMGNLIKRYPGNKILAEMKKNYDAQQAQLAQMQQQNNSWVDKPAPDLSLPDGNGNPVSLASFKGKFLLVDIWASWCSPCRMENPNVVKAYDEFKDKNFTILGISLDKEKDPWQQAIIADKLAWTQVSDLKFWNSKAVEVFKFGGIPFNVLIDPQGKIIAQDSRGEALENKLKEVL